ncbi:MAG: dihydrofolate reductase [Prevotella sp.]|nr:dihydrofolate reductase [Bacteroides sp.]MCM1366653.1 dihydrofolate reductase [Prevotella sp.]MCM1437320.1 dihydrofolate reductase [Prevotella sp.]
MEINSVYPSDSEEKREKEQWNIRPQSLNSAEHHSEHELAIIVALGRDLAIGRDNDLIRHLPGDLKRFKELTMGHTVIMGRKTWESLPKRPLAGRRNIVVTRNNDYRADGAETASSLEEAVIMANDDSIPFIIGGGEIYRQALPMTTRLFLTQLDADTPDADTFFPPIDFSRWETTFKSEPYTNSLGEKFRFIDLKLK